MESIITQAPIQTRDDTTDKNERLFPLLTSEALIRTREYQTGKEQTRIDFWNTLGLKIDTQFQIQTEFTERTDFITSLIDARYSILKDLYGIDPEDRVIIRDDANDVMNIMDMKVENLIARNIFQPYEESFTCCSDCSRVIAPAGAQITFCPNCKGENLHYNRRRGLFMVMPPTTKTWIEEQVKMYPGSSTHLIHSALQNMPLTIQVSKQREFGLRLTKYGVDPDFILDPKIALALIGSIVRENGLGSLDTVVLGRDSIPNFIPYSLVLDPNSATKFVTLGLVPPYTSTEIAENSRSFYFPYLSLLMMDYKGNLEVNQQVAFINEHQKVKRKFASCISVMNNLGSRFSKINPFSNIERINEVGSMLKDYRIRDATLTLREIIYEDISKSYIEECKQKGLKPDPNVVKKLNQMFNLLYGENE